MTTFALLPTSVREETFAGITYHIDGELVPALTVSLTEKDIIYFEQHVLLWKNTSINIFLHTMRNVTRRIFGGIPIFITNAQGPGEISLSRDGVGHIFAIHLKSGNSIHVRENQFLAATHNVEYDFERVRGVSNMLFGGSQFFIDKFHCLEEDGVLWLHGYGNVFEKQLAAGEQIDIEPRAWLYKSPDLKMDTKIQRLSTIFFAGGYVVMNRFTGPGLIALQSMNSSPQTFMQNPLTGIIRFIIFIVIFAIYLLYVILH